MGGELGETNILSMGYGPGPPLSPFILSGLPMISVLIFGQSPMIDRGCKLWGMKTFDIHFFKTSNLSPDEKNAMRRNASGIWLVGGRIEAKSARAACAAYRKSGELGSNASKLRAVA